MRKYLQTLSNANLLFYLLLYYFGRYWWSTAVEREGFYASHGIVSPWSIPFLYISGICLFVCLFVLFCSCCLVVFLLHNLGTLDILVRRTLKCAVHDDWRSLAYLCIGAHKWAWHLFISKITSFHLEKTAEERKALWSLFLPL